MTEVVESSPALDALEVIDRNLKNLQTRELLTASEVTDLLLDLRLLLMSAEVSVEDDSLTLS